MAKRQHNSDRENQNAFREVNIGFAEDNKIHVARRLSGGGAVYHDLGNVNFTFIVDDSNVSTFDFAEFCRPVIAALLKIGVKADISGRNDMMIDGKKFSGNSQYMKMGRVMHHGTLMFDSDLDIVSKALKVSKDKIESKGVKSVRSHVTNIKPYADSEYTVEDFKSVLRSYMFKEFRMTEYVFSDKDEAAINDLAKNRYETWEWNFGESPKYAIEKERRIEGCGEIQAAMNVDHGIITAIEFHGDYFGNGDPQELTDRITGCKAERSNLLDALSGIQVDDWIYGLDKEQLIDIILR